MIILLITSVEAVAYWTPGYYEQEYTKYHVLENLPEMTMEDLLAVTDEMMAYLRGNREDLHVSAVIGGETREFFNAREIAHMEDVRGLFLGGLMLRRVCILILLLLAAFFWGCTGARPGPVSRARRVPASRRRKAGLGDSTGTTAGLAPLERPSARRPWEGSGVGGSG